MITAAAYGALAAFCVGFILLTIRRRRAHVRPLELWGHAAYSLWTGGEDCARWPADRATDALKDWYDVEDTEGLQAQLDGLLEGETDSRAWDLCRAIDVSRIGLAAAYLDKEEAWALVRVYAETLQASYRTWPELAKAFERGMHAWQDERGIDDPRVRGRVEHNLVYLRAKVWPHIEFGADLS